MDTNPESTELKQSCHQKSWSDDICRNIANSDYFPALVLDSDVQKKVIKRFLDFYLGGKVTKSLTVTDLVFSVISIMPLHMGTEDTPWNASEYTKEGTLFSLPEKDNIRNAEKEMNLPISSTTLPLSIDIVNSIDSVNNLLSNEVNSPIISLEHNVLIGTETELKELNESGNQETSETIAKEESSNTKQEPSESTNKSQDKRKGNEYLDTEINTENSNQNFLKRQKTENSKHKDDDDIDDTNVTCEGNKKSAKPKMEDNTLGIFELLPGLKWPGYMSYHWWGVWGPSYGPKENAAFILSCQNLLDHWDIDKNARIVLKFFFGVVALITMRGIGKSYRHVVRVFSGSNFLSRYIEYIKHFSDYDFQYSIPYKKFIGVCHRRFKKREKNTIIMLSKIINYSLIIADQLPPERRQQYFEISKPVYDDNPFKVNFLKSTVLVHTANFRLELVSMLQYLVDELGIETANVAIEVTYCEETAESWEKLKGYINNYLTPGSSTRTHHWACLIDENYFKDLSCTSNYLLAVILAVFNAGISRNQGIWLSSWIDKDKKEDLVKFKQIGNEMFEKLKSKNTVARLAAQSKIDNTIKYVN